MSKSKYYNKFEDDYDDEDRHYGKKLHQEHRRQVKNWKKAWTAHEEDYDDVEVFHSK